MGNEQSGADAESFLDRVKGRSSGRTDKIVVVRGAADAGADPERDEHVVNVNSVPAFHPILRSALRQPGVADPAELHARLRHPAVARLCERLAHEQGERARAVAHDQLALCAQFKEIDYSLSTLCSVVNERKRTCERFAHGMRRAGELHESMMRITDQILAVTAAADSLNSLLPQAHRLDRLDLEPIVSVVRQQAAPTADQRAMADRMDYCDVSALVDTLPRLDSPPMELEQSAADVQELRVVDQ